MKKARLIFDVALCVGLAVWIALLVACRKPAASPSPESGKTQSYNCGPKPPREVCKDGVWVPMTLDEKLAAAGITLAEARKWCQHPDENGNRWHYILNTAGGTYAFDCDDLPQAPPQLTPADERLADCVERESLPENLDRDLDECEKQYLRETQPAAPPSAETRKMCHKELGPQRSHANSAACNGPVGAVKIPTDPWSGLPYYPPSMDPMPAPTFYPPDTNCPYSRIPDGGGFCHDGQWIPLDRVSCLQEDTSLGHEGYCTILNQPDAPICLKFTSTYAAGEVIPCPANPYCDNPYTIEQQEWAKFQECIKSAKFPDGEPDFKAVAACLQVYENNTTCPTAK